MLAEYRTPAPRLRWLARVLLPSFIAIAIVTSAWVMHGCAPAADVPPLAMRIAQADCLTNRTALQLACVGAYSTKPEIDACRSRVKDAIDCTKLAAADGGADASEDR